MGTNLGQAGLWEADLPKSSSTQTTTFVNNMKLPIHRWFRYSAGFSAEWAATEMRASGATKVFDPFAGVGTTLFAAQQLGVASLGVDPHPFVARIAEAKRCWRSSAAELIERAGIVVSTARELTVDIDSESVLTRKCFRPEALIDLISLRESIEKNQQGDSIDLLVWLALVSILRPCSHVGTANWQYVLPNKTKAAVASPMPTFLAQVQMMASDMRQMQSADSGSELDYRELDIRYADSLPTSWADVVITSPPYANNFDYADATRLEMSFLGEISSWGDLRGLRESLLHSSSQQMARYDVGPALESEELAPIFSELKAAFEQLSLVRETKAGKKAYHTMAVAYFYDMALAWKSIRRVGAKGCSVCFVVGDSAPYGVHLPVDRWLGELALASGFNSFTFEKARDRNTKWKNRKHQVPLHEGMLRVQG